MNNILCFIKGIFNNQWTFSDEETGMNFWNTLWFFIGYCIAISTFSLYKQVRTSIAQYPSLMYFNLHLLPLLYVCIILVLSKKTINRVLVEKEEDRKNSNNTLCQFLHQVWVNLKM